MNFIVAPQRRRPMTIPGLGHNTDGVVLKVEARFFNTLAKYSGQQGQLCRSLEVPAGTRIGDLIANHRVRETGPIQLWVRSTDGLMTGPRCGQPTGLGLVPLT